MTCDFLQGNGTHLECKFTDSYRLCVDLPVSTILSAGSLSDAFHTAGLETVSEEFVIAIMWDASPEFSSIANVLATLTADFRISTQSGKAKGHVHRLILSKGVLSALVIPETAGRVKVVAGGAVLGMTWQDLGKMAIQWELRPDLAFCTTSGVNLLPHSGDWQETVTAMESISLREELPYAEITKPGKASPEKSSADGSMRETPIAAAKSPSSMLLTPAICPTCSTKLIGDSCDFCLSFSPPRVGKNLAQDFEIMEPATKSPQKPVYETIGPAAKSPEKQNYEGISDKWTCECGRVNYSLSNTICSRCRKKKAQPVAAISESEKWKCPECDSMNPSNVALCPVCSRQDKANPTWICAKCSATNNATFKFCRNCTADRRPKTTPNLQNGTASKQQGTKPPGTASNKAITTTQVEQWICSKCGTSNSKSRENCVKCRKSKGTIVAPPAASHNITCPKCGNRLYGASECSFCAAAPKTEQKASPSKPVEEQKRQDESKWTCQRCGEKDNYSDEAICYQCSKPRLSATGGTWNCDNCQAVNMEQDSTCMLCYLRRSPKPAVGLVKNSPAKWSCKSCHRENAEEKASCSNCYKPRDPVPVSQKCLTCERFVVPGERLCSTCKYKPPEPKSTVPATRAAFTSYEPRTIPDPPKPKRLCPLERNSVTRKLSAECAKPR